MIDDCGFRRKQWLSKAIVENGVAKTGEFHGIEYHGLSFSARHKQVEQNRASIVFIHHTKLAWSATLRFAHSGQLDQPYDDKSRIAGQVGGGYKSLQTRD